MKPNLITEGRKAMIRRLGSITPANGYRTNAGERVSSGWLTDIVNQDTSGFPLIVVQKARDLEPKPGPAAMVVHPGFHVIGAVEAGFDGYDDALEDLQEDLLRCLMPELNQLPAWLPKGVTAATYGAAQSFPPGEGLRCATVVIPIYLKTVIQKG
ncbi:hypothetical protein PKB_5023 [Pseudomonas knackmussii B13]|uniref:Uncharacterized protein n=1 Tax=Pseudomonas knackmussii (strain DSM 6978 / CCUG 54928 / LMG 23759 / B13) TaxID=1301098 RepID=A0A024HN85_PSEKB|nr:hypothetical protein [Pseudomonas knackmussii]CDF86336.1 hypothetical protein PKB_5023 [Pseudomonas knackmussii B13]